MEPKLNISTIGSYIKFEKLIADFAQSFVAPLVEQKLKDSNFCLAQTSFEFILINGFSEITNSLTTLKLIEKFIKIVPPKEDGINYSNYLTYHVHNYLQEMYILKERLKTYATKIQRQYNKVIDKDIVKNIIESLIKLILGELNGITGESGARNLHVHAEKFKDNELNLLSSTIFLSSFHDEFKMESEVAYNKAKEKWSGIVENNNETLNKLIDIYFNTLYTILSLNDKVVLPEVYIKTI